MAHHLEITEKKNTIGQALFNLNLSENSSVSIRNFNSTSTRNTNLKDISPKFIHRKDFSLASR